MDRAARYAGEGLSADTARLLAFRPDYAAFFDAGAQASGNPQALANLMLNEPDRVLGLEPAGVAKLVQLIGAKAVTSQNVPAVLDRMGKGGGDPGGDHRARRPRRDGRRRRARRDRRRPRWPPTPTPPTRSAAGT
jgi:Asp-tRNA(Asn)/Glu-tRNA(Gln) amidotransferase B subunit